MPRYLKECAIALLLLLAITFTALCIMKATEQRQPYDSPTHEYPK